jgi:hypothetical protein
VNYVRRGFDYPIGWDSSFYVWRANAVGLDGLARLGTVRSGSPLLLAVLMQATHQNALTLVAVVPAVLAGVVGLGAAVMVRSSLEIEARWVPVVGILAWAAFVDIGIMQGHLDNALNVALVMCGLAAAMALVRGGRGAVAAAMLLAAAGVAEWPFFVFGAAILVGGLVLFAIVAARADGGVDAVRAPLWRLGIAVLASGVNTGLTFLGIPSVGGVGAGIADPATRALLKQRFIERLHDTVRYWAFPLALAGGLVAAREPVSKPARAARALFLCVMVSWTVMTIVAGLAQWAGAPVAGGRLTSYFFVAPILTGVLVWWLARWAADRIRPRAGAIVAGLTAAAIAIVAVAGFGFASWDRTRSWHPWMEPEAVAQLAAAGRYLEANAPGSAFVVTLGQSAGVSDDTIGRWWNVVQASLPAQEARVARQAVAPPADVAAGAGSPIVVVIQRYNKDSYPAASTLPGARQVAAGVVVVHAPSTATAPAGATPKANTSAGGILLTGALLVAILFACGLGWALALLPRDPVTVVGLAPGLALATIILVTLAWDVVGLPLHGLDPLWPLAIAAVGGWAAWWVRSRSAPDPVTLPS